MKLFSLSYSKSFLILYYNVRIKWLEMTAFSNLFELVKEYDTKISFKISGNQFNIFILFKNNMFKNAIIFIYF